MPSQNSYIIYAGDESPRLGGRITGAQTITNMGVTDPSQINAFLLSEGSDLNIFGMNIPRGAPRGLLVDTCTQVMKGVQDRVVHLSELPPILLTGTRFIWVPTNGSVSLTLVGDKS